MKKLLLIQIDGLSSQCFDKAIEQNRLPFVQELINQGIRKREFFCGVPSTTPATQMRLFYGLDDIIVGFRFLIKDKGLMFNPTNSAVMQHIEEFIRSKKTLPLLRNGATVMSHFTGGSMHSMSFTKLAKDRRIFFSFLSYVKNPLHVLVYFLQVGVMLVIDILENRFESKKGIHRRTNLFVHLLKRILIEFSQGELATYFTRKLIWQHKPIIFVNYSGYDVLAHHYGPESIFSLNYLSMIDLYIKNLMLQIKRSHEPYEVVIFSDHGQTPAQSYTKQIGQSLGDSVSKLYPTVKIIEHAESMHVKQLRDVDIYLLDSGGLSLMYAPKISGHLTHELLDRQFPKFTDKVSRLPGVEFVLSISKGKPYVSQNGHSYTLMQKGCEKLFWFADKSEQQLLHRQMQMLIDAPFAADAYIFGKVLGKDEVVGFENQNGTHGGIGGPQTRSFMLSHKFTFDETKISGFCDIHRLLNQYIYDQADKNGQNHLRTSPNS